MTHEELIELERLGLFVKRSMPFLEVLAQGTAHEPAETRDGLYCPHCELIDIIRSV